MSTTRVSGHGLGVGIERIEESVEDIGRWASEGSKEIRSI
jgi:hypothetical protein